MKKQSPKTVNIASGGFTSPYSVLCASDVESYTFYGNKTLGSNFAIQASGTPAEGMTCWMWFTGAITPVTYTFTIFGTAINPKIIIHPWFALCKYTGSAWYVVYASLNANGADGVGITVDADGNFSITPLGIVNSMIGTSAAIDWSKITKDIVNADVNANAAIALTKLAALAATQLVGSDGSGFLISLDTATYPSLAELAFLKNVSSAIQTQLDTLTGTFADYTTTADLITLLGSYATTTAMNLAIAAALLTVKPLVGKGILGAGTTTLDATALDYYLVGTDTGAATINLPASADKDDGFVLTIKLTGGNTATSIIQTQSSNVLYSAINTSVATITGMGNGSWYKLRNHQGTGAAGSWEIMEYVII